MLFAKQMRADNLKPSGKCQMNDLDNRMSSLQRRERPDQVVRVGPVGKVNLELDLRRGRCWKVWNKWKGVVSGGFASFSDFADKTLSPASAKAMRAL